MTGKPFTDYPVIKINNNLAEIKYNDSYVFGTYGMKSSHDETPRIFPAGERNFYISILFKYYIVYQAAEKHFFSGRRHVFFP